jgi:hypothetical protein
MQISRRRFLGAVTGSAATLLSFRPIGLYVPGPCPERKLDSALIDLHSQCVLRESLQGYQAALSGEHNFVPEPGLDSQRRWRIAIVPSLGPIDPATAQTLSDLLNAGTHLLLESGAGFLSPAEFASHQRMLDRYFNLAVGPRVDLWPGNTTDEALFAHRSERYPRKKLDRQGSIPYVHYVWPRETIVRDFSRLIPVSAQVGEVIGSVGGLPVALKKQVGKGTLIFLGSPLGPLLRAGDPEARSWLQSVTAL